MSDLAVSFAECRRITSQAKSSFAFAFRLLPRDQRQGMTALYAWLRLTDDLADGPGDVAKKRAKLKEWRAALDGSRRLQPASQDQNVQLGEPVTAAQAKACGYQSEILPAFLATVSHFQIPLEHLHAVIDGVESDLIPGGFANFKELERYCYRVASAVGLCCLAIWGVRDPAAVQPAIDAGTAFQLTNILRDLGDDARNNRAYIPRDEFARYEHGDGFPAMMQFQIARAREYYAKSEALKPLLPRRPRAMFTAMSGIYQRLLDEIERDPQAVMTRRVRVSRLRKAMILLRSLVK